MWDVHSFLSQILTSSLVFGFIFQFPIFLTFLIRLGALKLDFLKKKRKYAIAIIFIFVSFLPPDELLSTLLQAFPLIILFEITLRLNSLFPPMYEIERRRAEKLEIKTIEEQTPSI